MVFRIGFANFSIGGHSPFVKCRFRGDLCVKRINLFTELQAFVMLTVKEGFSMITIKYIQEYIALVDTMNFSKAAEKLYITQPALSRHIAAIEEEMGAKLLERTTRSVAVTPAGKAVYDSFQEMLRSYSIAREKVSDLSAGRSGALKISSPYYWTEDHTEPVVERFLEEIPLCDVKLFSCQPQDGLIDIEEHRTDILISTPFSDLNDSIRRVFFKTEPLAVVCRTDHPLAGRTSMKLEEIRDDSIISLDFRHSVFEDYNAMVLSLLEKRNIYPTDFTYTQQVDTVGLSLRKHGGVSIVPYGVRHMDRAYLSVIPLEDEDCMIPMYLYYHFENDNPMIPRFIHCAEQTGREEPLTDS